MNRNLMFAGDTHGNLGHWHYLIQTAVDNDCIAIFQVGDLGLWTHTKNGRVFLQQLQQYLAFFNMPMFFLPGNHEAYSELAKLSLTPAGIAKVTNHIFYLPRASRIELGGYDILTCGGAYSIDRSSRVEGVSWWPEELITYGDIQRCLDSGGQPDIIATHDCPEVVPSKVILPRGLYPIEAARQQRVLLDHLYEAYRPKLWVHGHFHNRYSWATDTTKFEGLGCDMMGKDSWLLLKTK